MSFFDEIAGIPAPRKIELPGKNCAPVVVWAHALTGAEMATARLEEAARLRNLPEGEADKLWRARVIALGILKGDDPRSDPVFAKTELERVANLPYAVESELFDAVVAVNSITELKKNLSMAT